MTSTTLWMGTITEKPIELGPDETWAFDDRHAFTPWFPQEVKRILRQFEGETVRISIERVIPLRTDLPWRPHEAGEKHE